MYLEHHGIKGQRWGIRRFQNKDGSLTPSGEERYRKKATTESTAADITVRKAVSMLNYMTSDDLIKASDFLKNQENYLRKVSDLEKIKNADKQTKFENALRLIEKTSALVMSTSKLINNVNELKKTENKNQDKSEDNDENTKTDNKTENVPKKSKKK